jgi:hypothetical protein
MSANNGIIFKYISAIALLISLVPSPEIRCQVGILDSTFTFSAGTIKTVNALNLITRQTGYHFTYDSRLVDPGAKSEMNFRQTKLKVILDSILGKDSLLYSVIDQFIIISREIPPPPLPSARDTTELSGINIISGIILDGESSESLPFATIALKKNGRGTVSNNNGEFGLKLLQGDHADTIVVSYLGYFAREIPVIQSLGSNFIVEMKRE